MVVPIVYRKSGEGSIASYDFTDIAEGTGIVNFCGIRTYQAGAYGYILSKNSTYSQTTYTESANVGTPASKVLDLDFDIVFNMPQRIKGNAYVTATVGANTRNTGTTSVYFIAKIRKWNGSAESEIASGTSVSLSYVNNPGAHTNTVQIPITTLAHFKKDETLRLTMEIWADSSGGSSTVALWHDPMERTATPLTTAETLKLNFFCPFVLDL